ncbi:MAG: acyl carrier protein [Lachnospiraceae bacterium]|nr:acyl carrier protein [Lachnospiraceae bacterium]
MKKIIEFLQELRPEFDFTQSENYIEEGMLDSFDIVSLVSMMDKEYGISVKGREIVPENFSSLKQIQALVKKYGVTDEV